jgi:hypothetical protein
MREQFLATVEDGFPVLRQLFKNLFKNSPEVFCLDKLGPRRIGEHENPRLRLISIDDAAKLCEFATKGAPGYD